MTVEYDLVVIGGSTAGVYAATAAAQMKARVALVNPQLSGTPAMVPEKSGYRHKDCLLQVVRVGGVAQRLRERAGLGFGINVPATERIPSKVRSISRFPTYSEKVNVPAVRDSECGEESNARGMQFADAQQWAATVESTLQSQQEPALLASLGVDVIIDRGEFVYHRNQPVFAVSDRRLRASAYLIATGSSPDVPDLEGLLSTGYVTTETLGSLEKLPETLVVIGSDAVGVELGQTLARLGSRVTLVVSSPQIFPKEDPEAGQLIQAQLEAEGIKVLTQTEVTQAQMLENKKWIQAGNKAIEADEIFLAMGQRVGDVACLNLEAVGVKWNARCIQTNQKLQTTNPRIYACGDIIGGYRFGHLAIYEAGIALKNALFLPRFNVDYLPIPWAIFSSPELARVGLTEAQARRRYGKDVLAVRQYFKTVDAAVIRGETTGFCKLIGRRNGKILGATIVGPAASESIGTFALAMGQKIKLGSLNLDAIVRPTLSEIISQTALEWRRERFTHNTRKQNFLETFFNLRRSWSN
ncbi:MAG: NAD(P)/FAD-dependent oxidoreductase [Hormoscilla sp. GM7CHS1pb]|nr:NAD(P)/FAD-dependent oxidoreductase [Hormoscilla sp. GM7CHS1pb]